MYWYPDALSSVILRYLYPVDDEPVVLAALSPTLPEIMFEPLVAVVSSAWIVTAAS
jgi:hypothetical protein